MFHDPGGDDCILGGGVVPNDTQVLNKHMAYPKNPKISQEWCHFEDPQTPLRNTGSFTIGLLQNGEKMMGNMEEGFGRNGIILN